VGLACQGLSGWRKPADFDFFEYHALEETQSVRGCGLVHNTSSVEAQFRSAALS